MTVLRGRPLAVYIFLCAVWGSTWLVIKIGLRDLPPLTFAGFRMALACLLIGPLAFSVKGKRPSRREALLVLCSGLLQIGLSYALLFIATQWIASGLAAILFASFPIWVGLFAHFLLPDEPLTARTIAAAAVGLAGVALIEAPAAARVFGSRGHLFAGGALVLASAIVSGYANVLNKRSLTRVAPAQNVWGQTLAGALLLLLGAAVFERGAPIHWTAGAVASLAYLAIFGTALTFAGLFWLIPKVPVAIIGTIPLVDTLIAVVLGNLVLHEKLSLRILAGGALILAGVLLAASNRRPAGVAGRELTRREPAPGGEIGEGQKKKDRQPQQPAEDDRLRQPRAVLDVHEEEDDERRLEEGDSECDDRIPRAQVHEATAVVVAVMTRSAAKTAT